MSILQRRFALIRRYVLGVSLVVPLFFAQRTRHHAAMVRPDGCGVNGIAGPHGDSQTYNRM